MALNDHLKLKGVTHFNKDHINKQLKYGVKEFLNWGFLGIGSFINVNLPHSGVYGGSKSQLRLASDKNYTDGQVWEGFKSDWVWETGIAFSVQPISISGVYVNGSFKPGTGIGTYAHKIDYPNGRVIFSSAIPTNSVVKAEFSYKNIRFVDYKKEFIKELMFQSSRVNRSDFSNAASGNWSQHPSMRASMPMVGIEVVDRLSSVPYELGSSRKIRRQDVIFYVLSENEDDKDQIVDILEGQDDKTFWIPNKNSIKVNNDFPLKYDGSLNSNPKTFPQMVAPTGVGGYRWRTVQFTNTKTQPIGDIGDKLYGGIVRSTLVLLD